ncbi:4a-hydroxytetrahydrobiopterin dehydratase [Actinokineospora globicatena]|uniref:Putative pterin-4-alpha-carbinolamine dehydratase n=1 Tax=Actinokineospora globicatena TaxID=103729 RepID=A0A9W6QLN7_9PSEU|nr:4a-hydroxytetrahydrobiopterin dehydratase [Actinokineospora globicatena]MCP2300513.1 pterin-4-alpha-carbinolamine dehydratase (EC 4.2.1.96) [Actinokineospora globicatena]GLW81056.1 4a-hydroxytetrahydrobiopterin dehydratase [Actinokineospora globicatena]GLW88249.1 4a-hydroxytetrahydrobiopterin dehydratase [Actinokineospora globicatena]GLW92723.1 4a-hydroxytetrahydrobiopterin dehydratase [Actinokineospora globicatena]
MAQLLSDPEIGKALGRLPKWRLVEGGLVLVAQFADFAQAIQAVNRVAEIAENDNHHPDIDIRWNKVTFRCSTHSAGGVTALDTSLATEIDGIVSAIG